MTVDYGVWGLLNDELAGPAPDEFTEYMTGLAGPGGSVFEVGIGSGRLALPLARAGLTVQGIDTSHRMLTLLKENDVEGLITAWVADATSPIDAGRYDVVLLAYNVLSMLPDRSAQRRCLATSADLVAPGGHLVVENVAPCSILTQLNTRNQALGVQFVDDNVWLNLGRYYPAEERFLIRYLAFEDEGFVQRHGDLTLISPEQIRPILEAAGLELTRLAEDWVGTPYATSSGSYVVTYARP